MTPKEWDNFFYCETSLSLNIGKVLSTISLYVSIKGQQRSSWTFFWDFHLLNLSKALNKYHEDLCWTLIDTYKLAV